MPIDPRNLRPSDLAKLLNSTPLGTVTDERQLYRYRVRAGYRIGDGKRVDLFRYTAWLVHARNCRNMWTIFNSISPSTAPGCWSSPE